MTQHEELTLPAGVMPTEQTPQPTQVNRNVVSIEDILGADFGEGTNELRVDFKKTVLIRDYETEVIEATTTLKLDKPLSGAERAFVQSLLLAQMEYAVYVNLYCKGIVMENQYKTRVGMIENDITAIKNKAEQILGPGKVDYLLKCEKDMTIKEPNA